MKSLFKIVMLLYFCFCGSITPQDLLIDTYNKHDGLIQSSVVDINQDAQGMIWLYTEKGISAFDGIQFYNFIDTTSLFDVWLADVCVDSSGIVYMLNFNNEIWQWNREKFKKIELPEEIAELSIGISVDNNLLVGSGQQGLFIYKDGDWSNITKEMGLYSNTIASIKTINNVTLVATSLGLNKLIKDKPVRLFSYNNLNVRALLFDSQDRFWLGTVNGLFLYHNASLKSVNKTAGMLIEDIAEDKKDNIWIASRNGLSRIKPGSQNYDPETIINETDFRTLLIDREGIVWGGTIGKGIFKIRQNPFRSFTSVNGFSLRSPFPMLADSKGTLWIGTDHGLVKRVNNNWIEEKKLAGKMIINLFESDDNTLWITTPGGIFTHSNEETRPIDGNALKGSCRFVTQDMNGNILFGTSNKGIWQYKNGTLLKSPLSRKLSSTTLYSTFRDSRGVIWIGTSRKGIIKIDKDAITHIDSKKGVTADFVLQFDEDSSGKIWAAATDGVYVIDTSNNILKYSTEEGLVTNTCYSIITHDNYAFVGTSDGMNLIDGNSMQLFTTGDGLLNNDCNTNALLIDEDDNLWIGTYSGISIINLKELVKSKSGLECIITKLNSPQLSEDLWASEKIKKEKKIILEPGYSQLNITCAGFYFTNPQSITYTYKLISDKDTTLVTTKNKRFKLSNTAPGNYVFYAEANTPGFNSKQSINLLSITVLPSFFQSGLFFYLIALILIAIISFFLLLHKKKLKQKEESKYKTSSLTKENYAVVKNKIVKSFEEDKVYCESELSLQKLADQLNIHKEHISQVVNKEYGKNFNEFVNTYRIEEAKKLLVDDKSARKNILSIAHEVGFNSKTTFNTTFKKFTGLTPTEFKYSNQQ